MDSIIGSVRTPGPRMRKDCATCARRDGSSLTF